MSDDFNFAEGILIYLDIMKSIRSVDSSFRRFSFIFHDFLDRFIYSHLNEKVDREIKENTKNI